MAAADAFKNPEHVEKLVKGSTEFALDLYKEVSSDLVVINEWNNHRWSKVTNGTVVADAVLMML